jgi:hypothetical protein
VDGEWNKRSDVWWTISAVGYEEREEWHLWDDQKLREEDEGHHPSKMHIKDVTEWLLTKDEDIKNMWREYFDKLFNKNSESSSIELDISSDDLNRQFVCRIQKSEIKDALKRMKGGKMMSPNEIPI